MLTKDHATFVAVLLFTFFGSVACGAEELVVFSQPDVSDIGDRVYVTERRPLGKWFMISWQKSPFTADGKFVPVDWDAGEKTGLSIPDEHTRRMAQRGMRNAAGSTVCQMYDDTVGAYLNSADLSGKGLDAKGNPLPGSNGYKQMVTPSYMFGPAETIHPWRAPDSRLQVSLDLQIPTAVCAEKKGSLAYVNPLLTLVDPKTKLKISWGPMLFSKRSKGDHTKPLQNIAYDAPSHSWMIRDRLVPGASWLELAPDSASYQTAPWRGWRHFSWSVSRAHVTAALKAMRQQEPQVKLSIDPGDYQLTAFHLNAETHFQTAPAELGWSMRNLRIAVVGEAASGAEKEGTLKADPLAAAAADSAFRLRAEPLHTYRHAPDALKPAKPTLFAVYYAWYHDGAHPQRPWLHWTKPDAAKNPLALQAQRPGEPAPASAARPLVGFYDSADPTIARWHVQLARAAGIDAFLVSWWDQHNGVDQDFERGILPAAEKEGFKIALFDERAQFHDTLENYQRMLTRALRRYKDSPAYLRLDGRPVVYLYQVARKPGLTAEEFPRLKRHVEGEVGPVYWIVDKIEHDTWAACSGDSAREKRIPAEWLATPGIDSFGFYSTFSNFRAHRYEELAGKYRYLTRLAHEAGKKMLLPVHPGHNNSHFREGPNVYVMPRRDGQTLRDYLRAASAAADHILITSWNEWPETTVIEPSCSWPNPYLYLEVVAEWKGVEFIVPPLPPVKTVTSTFQRRR